MSPQPHVLVTGGSRGIGAATCRLAAAHGWAVTVNYRTERAAAQVVADAIIAEGGRAAVAAGDVAGEADVIAMFDAAEAALGPITGVVGNAGISAQGSKLADMDADRIRRVIDVNVTGALLTAREAARRMSRSRGGAGGSIVLVSSAAATIGGGGVYVDYSASKGAIDVLTLGLGRELGPEGIRVNGVRPGMITTEIHAVIGDADRAIKLGPTTPLGRAGTPEEVAEAIVWLMSDAASYVNSAMLDVTAGR